MDIDKVDNLKWKLASVRKQKEVVEKEASMLKNREIILNNELRILYEELENLGNNLAEITKKISETKQQTSIIEICESSEMAKFKVQTASLHQFQMGFDNMFDQERAASEQYQMRLNEEDMRKVSAQKELDEKIQQQNDKDYEESVHLETECNNIEKECAILKKRNTAVMLKLRRKLMETETLRRELINNK